MFLQKCPTSKKRSELFPKKVKNAVGASWSYRFFDFEKILSVNFSDRSEGPLGVFSVLNIGS